MTWPCWTRILYVHRISCKCICFPNYFISATYLLVISITMRYSILFLLSPKIALSSPLLFPFPSITIKFLPPNDVLPIQRRRIVAWAKWLYYEAQVHSCPSISIADQSEQSSCVQHSTIQPSKGKAAARMWCRTSAESSRPIIPPLTPNQQTFTWEQPLDLPVWLLEQDPVPSFAVRLTPTIEKTVGDNRKDRQNVKGYVLPL